MTYKIYTLLASDGDWMEHKDKGSTLAYVATGSKVFRLEFHDVYSLKTYLFPDGYSLGKYYPLSPMAIVVPEVTKEEVKRTVGVLVTDGYFENIQPMKNVQHAEDIEIDPVSGVEVKLYPLD